MNKIFSPTTGGFYAQEMKADYEAAGSWPLDGVEVEPIIEQAIRDAISRGDTVTLGGGGEWLFTPPPPPPFQPQADAYMARVRIGRDDTINRLTGLGFVALMTSDMPTAQAVMASRQLLLDITGLQPVVTAATMDELTAAINSAYAAIVAGAPANLQTAFKPTLA